MPTRRTSSLSSDERPTGTLCVGDIRDDGQQRVQLCLDRVELFRQPFELGIRRGGFRHQGSGVLPFRFRPADLLGERVPFRLELLGAALDPLPLVLERAERRLVEDERPVGEALRHTLEIGSKQLNVDHMTRDIAGVLPLRRPHGVAP